jgi:hypothetical protein
MVDCLRCGGMLARLALAAFLVISMAVPAQAQAPRSQFIGIEATGPALPIEPETGTGTASLVVTVSCDVVLGAMDATGARTAPVTIAFTVGEGDVVLTGPTTLSVPATDCQSGALEASIEQQYQVVVARTTVAFMPVTIDVQATVNTTAPPGSLVADASFPVTAGPVFATQAVLARKIQACSCDSIPFTIELTNYGNAHTRLSFALASLAGGGWSADVPADVELFPGGVVDVVLLTHLDGGNEQQAFELVVTSTSVDDPAQKGDDLHVTVLARHKAFLGIPGPGAPILLVLLALGAAFSRRE